MEGEKPRSRNLCWRRRSAIARFELPVQGLLLDLFHDPRHLQGLGQEEGRGSGFGEVWARYTVVLEIDSMTGLAGVGKTVEAGTCHSNVENQP